MGGLSIVRRAYQQNLLSEANLRFSLNHLFSLVHHRGTSHGDVALSVPCTIRESLSRKSTGIRSRYMGQ